MTAVVGLAAFVASFRVGLGAARESLDGSWSAVLSWAFSHGAQFGSDIIFTHGPLGFLSPIATYYPNSHSLYFAAQVFLSTVFALLAGHFARRLSTPAQVAMVVLLLLWAPLLIIDVSWYLLFAFGAVLFQEIAERSASAATLALAVATALALTVLGLTKFTLTLLWLAFVAYALLQLLLARRTCAALVLPVTAAALYCALWLACGQHLSSLPLYLTRGLETSLGYGAAMGHTPPPLVDLAGLAVLVLSSACLLPLLLRGAGGHRRVLGGFLLLILTLTWKAGYTRADTHVGIFLGTASLLIFLSAALLPPTLSPRLRRWQGLGVAAASVLGIALTYQVLGGFLPTLRSTWDYVAYSLKHSVSPRQLRAVAQATWDNGRRDLDLPATRELVGDASVDLLMHEQGFVLLNGFRYSPRPAFQGYAASDTLLARRNETKLLGDSAPQFLLFKLQAIDSHLPGSEDPLSQLAALRAYTPRIYEKEFVVLERERRVEPVLPPTVEHWREATLGSDIALDPMTPQLLFYHVELSVLGRLYALLLREPELGVEVNRRDGVVTQYRLPRRLGDAGTLVSPLLSNVGDYLAWYSRQRDRDIASIRLVPRNPKMSNLFVQRITYALTPIDLPRATGALPDELRRAFYPGFSHSPQAQRSPVPIAVIDNLGSEVLFMHAPSSLDFVLPRGNWRAEGRFGLRADSYAPGVCPQSDGTRLRVYQRSDTSSEPTLLYSRQIDPLRVSSDRGNLAFSTTAFFSDGSTSVTFEFSGGESATASTDCDWTVLGPLRFISTETP
jgi:hypothetical protein